MSADNPTWGEEHISNELKVKLGIRVSPRTVQKYLAGHRGRTPDPSQRWLHTEKIIWVAEEDLGCAGDPDAARKGRRSGCKTLKINILAVRVGFEPVRHSLFL